MDLDSFRDVIARHLGVARDQVPQQALLADELGVSSIDLVDIVGRLEREHGVEFTNVDFDGVRTVADAWRALCASQRS